MRPFLHPFLVNGRTGDPAVFVETQFERRAFLFDLGETCTLAPRKIHRLEQVFVSHAHIDHFIGFDHLLRVLVGRDKTLSVYGPPGFIDHVGHKLGAYRWNLVDRYACDLVFLVREVASPAVLRQARFRLKNGFAREPMGDAPVADGRIHSDPLFRVSATILEHRTPSIAYGVEESAHVNIWKNRLAELQLPVGPWLRDLKRAVLEARPDDHRIDVSRRPGEQPIRSMTVGELRGIATLTPGQKIAYVADAADTAANRRAIVALARNADLLFIEAAIAGDDAAIAAERAHLTTTAAGEMARAAGVRRVEPFHFSPRYAGQDRRMLDEVMAAFAAVDSSRDL